MSDDKACAAAVQKQAFAEDRWTSTLQEHFQADAKLAESPESQEAHDNSAGFLTGARIAVIHAEAEVRNRCG